MRVTWTRLISAITFTLSACVSASLPPLSKDNPANPAAPAGFVDAPAAIDAYKSPEDFAKRAAADVSAPPQGAMSHEGMQGMTGMPGMKGMQHGDMHHGGASHDATPQ